MDEIANLKVKILETLDTIETTESFKHRAELIDMLIRFRNLLNTLESSIINHNMLEMD